MKFYYNDKLVRTSKTHEYKYAVINKQITKSNPVKSCSTTYEGCVKYIEKMISDCFNPKFKANPEQAKYYEENYIIVELECRA